ncbi:hypothetical protein ABPG72_021166 [Tetrahymena utriculariae]
MTKDKNKKSKEKEESSHLEEFYKLRSPLDIAEISLNKQKSHRLFFYGNIRNNIIKKIQMKEFLLEKQRLDKQKLQNEQNLIKYAHDHLVPQIIDEYQKKSCFHKEVCKILRLKFKNKQFYSSLNEQYRKKMWLIATDAFYQKKDNKDYFKKILKSEDIPNVYEDFIEKDLMRSFCKEELESHPQLAKQIADKLRNVLSAYSKLNCIAGYCQGMNFIAKFILILQFDEEEAFWIYKYFLESMIPLDYYTNNMIGLIADQNIFKNLLQVHNPKVFKKFQEIKIDVNIFTTSWFICLYTNSLSQQLCTVVFDHCILYGAKTIFIVGLVLLDTLQEDILKAQGHEILMIIEEKARKLQDKEMFHQKLIEIYLSKKGIELQREIYRDIYAKQIKEDKNLNQKTQITKKIKCNRNWRICLVNLHTEKMKKFEGVFVFRNNHDMNIQHDHCTLEKAKIQKQRQFKSEDPSNINNILIVRLDHTCNEEQQIKPLYRQSTVNYSLNSLQLQNQTSLDMHQKMVNNNLAYQNNHEKQLSILQIGQKVVSYYPTDQEVAQMQSTQDYQNQQTCLNGNKEESKNIENLDNNSLQAQNIAERQDIPWQENELMKISDDAHSLKQTFNEINQTNLNEDPQDEDNIDDFEVIAELVNQNNSQNDKIKASVEIKTNLYRSSYYKFYSQFKGKNQVYGGLLESDITTAQTKYFQQIQ